MVLLHKYQSRALEILQSDRCRSAFDLDREPAGLRERYGNMPAFDPKDAQRCGALTGHSGCCWRVGWLRPASDW